MSGAEVIAVVACVAAVVSAYHDGGQLFRSIKEKWHNRRQPNHTSAIDLEWSLIRGSEDILTHWNIRAAHLGRRYEEGDAIAREQMKDIVITLQSALLTHLRYAEGHEARLDMVKLLAASDRGRASTISVLHDLYQRQAQTAAVPWPIALPVGPSVVDPASSLGYYMGLIDRQSSSPLSDSRKRPGGGRALEGTSLPGMITGSPPESHGFARQTEPISPLSRDRRSSTFGSIGSWWKDIRRRSSADATSVAEVESITRPASQAPVFPQIASYEPEIREDEADAIKQPPKAKRLNKPIEQDEITRELTTNMWNHDTKSETDSETEFESAEEGDMPSFQRSLPTRDHSIAPVPASIRGLGPAASIASPTIRFSTQDRASAPSIASSDTTSSNPSTYLPRAPNGISYWPPSKDNKYSGFCKGAWKLSSGMGGLKVHSEPVGYFTSSPKLRCYKCFFAMPLAKDSSRHDHRPDTNVYVHKATGIRYRWFFLAKSHVECKRADVEMPNYALGTFGCIFCCAQRNEMAPRFETLDAFMVHLAVHRCMNAAALLERTRCVVGRVAGDDEEFDINIPFVHTDD
ncbi:uncharacterized protein N7477_006314 [Penicillium maclennaniae]|uniref:uncharacterized protein n=1 Tax=Penicillium maclennaniae TaxID=1343394 RepID=UPI0025415D78|nr:uncharacterized protein N7477_006314 [Penicillium maclennaniae]KAJ5667744.1 hypothetical protein N7477_006314 [Penicillium maclennaniae]